MRPGFTLVEMLVVLAIIAVAAGAALSVLPGLRTSEVDTVREFVKVVETARSEASERGVSVTLSLRSDGFYRAVDARGHVVLEGRVHADSTTAPDLQQVLVQSYGPVSADSLWLDNGYVVLSPFGGSQHAR